MKIHLLALILLLFIIPGCSKFFFNPKDRLEGEWKLHRVKRIGVIGWRNIDTGYENGVFRFFENGQATYIEGPDTLKGNWRVRTRWGRYWDENGNDMDGERQELDINLYRLSTGEAVNFNFDDIRFSGNRRFTGVYQEWARRYSYTFRRI